MQKESKLKSRQASDMFCRLKNRFKHGREYKLNNNTEFIKFISEQKLKQDIN